MPHSRAALLDSLLFAVLAACDTYLKCLSFTSLHLDLLNSLLQRTLLECVENPTTFIVSRKNKLDNSGSGLGVVLTCPCYAGFVKVFCFM